MSDDSDFIQANLLRHAERERIRKALEPDDRIRRAQLEATMPWWPVLVVFAVVACVVAVCFR